MLSPRDIVCYIPVYNDREALKRCIEKLKKLGIRILVVDGRYTDFPQIGGFDHSVDGSGIMAVDMGAYVWYCEPGREEDKLNVALQKAKDMDAKVFMYCGADAYFEGDIDEFMLSLQRYYEQYAVEPTQISVETVELQPDAKWNNTSTRQPRILLNYWKFEAKFLHWTLFEREGDKLKPVLPVNEIVEGIKLYHDNSIRPKERDDMMTKYQDGNVPRERDMYMKHLVPKAYDKMNIMTWHLDKDGTYEQARKKYFEHDYTHLILAGEGYTVTQEKLVRFVRTLDKRNNTWEAVDLLSAVWKSPTHENNITLNPTGEETPDFSRYERIHALYSPKGIPNEGEAVIVAPYTGGPVMCMSSKAVRLLEHMGDKLDLHAILGGLGLQIFVDMRIQYDG